MSRPKRRFATTSAARFAAAVLGMVMWAVSALAATEPVYPGNAWAQAPLESDGWSANGWQAADDTARAVGSTAYLVVHHGQVVHAFGAIDQPINLHSARKSILSMLYGIAVARQQIDLGKTLAESGITDKGGLSATEQGATLRELLEARSGVYHSAAYETIDMMLARPVRGSHTPGQFWYYNNWDFNTLGTIYQQRTGHSVFEGLEQELAGPLDFEDFRVSRDTLFVYERGSDHPAYLMHLSARDLARIGLLMARNGRWQNRQIIPARWVAESTTSYSDAAPGIGYGYLWWVGLSGVHFHQRFPGAVFSARGHLGQFLLVDPTRDLVIVHLVRDDRLFTHSVSTAQFNTLLAQILRAAPAGF